jgi:osmotically-inducible protein OsmY
MRTDSQIERDVVEELATDPEVCDAGIGAHVEGGTVRLTGSAPTYAGKVAAHRAAERISGVRGVIDEVIVLPPAHLARGDTAIGRAVAIAFELNVQVPPNAIAVSVTDGWVALSGAVSTQADRCAAEAAVTVLAGVRGIVNRIAVEPTVTPCRSIILGIERALQRSAELDSKHIVIDAAPDGEVRLRGTVRSWAEVHDAERAAWSAPGVREVVNGLAVVL